MAKRTKAELEQIKRNILFQPCDTKEHLHRWIKVFLDIDVPNYIVKDENNPNPSNSCPMDLIWELYSKMRDGHDKNFTQALGYAARDTFKTLSSAIVETLCLFHLDRDVCHLAAIEAQARKSREYVNAYFRKPILREFLGANSRRELNLVKYTHIETKKIISPVQFELLSKAEQLDYDIKTNSLKILVCNMNSVNGEHPNLLICVDGKTEVLIKKDDSLIKGIYKNAESIYELAKGDKKTEGGVEVISNINNLQALSFNFENGNVEFKPIQNAFKRKSNVVKLTFDNGKELVCTPSHPILTIDNGLVAADSLEINDMAIEYIKICSHNSHFVPGETYINDYVEPNNVDMWEQVLIGSLLGDGGIYKRTHKVKKYINFMPYFSENHCIDQKNYLLWKKKILSEKLTLTDRKNPRSSYTGELQYGFYSNNTELLLPYLGFKQKINLNVLNKLEAPGLAVWFMDDGNKDVNLRFSSHNFSYEDNLILSEYLKNKFGIETIPRKEIKKNGATYFYLYGTVESKRRLVDICRKYIHPDIEYKFDLSNNKRNCQYCGQEFFYYERGVTRITCSSSICKGIKDGFLKLGKLISKENMPDERWVYDFTVKDNHTFINSSMISGNCDELDLADPIPIEEAKMTATTTIDGKKLPLIFMTSTRKFAIGPVQQEIDNSIEKKTSLAIRHWNLLDVTSSCPPERHLPEEPKIPIYYSNDTLAAISEEAFVQLPDTEQSKFVKSEGYTGCLSNCKMFAFCNRRPCY